MPRRSAPRGAKPAAPRAPRSSAPPIPQEHRHTGLTERERRFVDAYMGEAAGNGTKAATLAGYSKTSARRIATRLSSKAHVRAAIAERGKDAGITRERVLQELVLLGFSDVTHYVVDDDGQVTLAAGAPPGAMRGLQSIKRKTTITSTKDRDTTVHDVEIKLWDKPGPLKLAGQHVGLFAEKHEHSGSVTLEMVLEASRKLEAPRG